MRAVADPARLASFRALRSVTAEAAFANLALARQTSGLDGRDAAFATELLAGTCRGLGLYDAVIESAGRRRLATLQPAVVDLLRLGTHQLLAMDVPARAAIATTVELARSQVGERVTGVVNAILRKVTALDEQGWGERLVVELGPPALALLQRHPQWIADAYAEVLPASEVTAALAANNTAPRTQLAVRPGLAEFSELGGEPLPYSPFGVAVSGSPGDLAAVRQGRAGAQDEGSQLVCLAVDRVTAPPGPWLDLCAGPGGKAALLAGLARRRGERLLAAELQPHRAELVAQAVRAYPEPRPVVVCADGLAPAWATASFSRVLLDAPCSGLGSLRRRPESRWRRKPGDLAELVPLQRQLLRTAIASAKPGGVVAYVTCSPVRAETVEVVEEVLTDGTAELLDAPPLLPEVPDAGLGRYVQLWPHRHGTDAMFLALLAVR